MKVSRFLVPILLGLAFATGAAADEPRYGYECDTPAGHFSFWKRTVSGAAIEVAGKLQVNEMLKDKKWTSTAFVSLRAEKPSRGDYGLRLYGIPKTPEFFYLELLKVGGHDPIGLGMIPATKEPIPFTLSLDATGLLKVTLGDADASTQLGTFKPETLELSCSGGDYEFKEVTVKERSPGGG